MRIRTDTLGAPGLVVGPAGAVGFASPPWKVVVGGRAFSDLVAPQAAVCPGQSRIVTQDWPASKCLAYGELGQMAPVGPLLQEFPASRLRERPAASCQAGSEEDQTTGEILAEGCSGIGSDSSLPRRLPGVSRQQPHNR